MKKTNLYLVAILMAFVFVACEPETVIEYQVPETVNPTTLVDFENVTLNANGIWNGSDLTGEFISSNSVFKNSYNEGWASWSGFACSSKNDTLTSGWVNQYSVISGAGAMKSIKFALAFDSAAFICPANSYGNFSIKSIALTNSTYTYLDMKNGSGFSKKFVAGDWYKIIITGYLNNTKKTPIEYYLSDFRNGKTFLSKTWEKVDLSSLGMVDKVTFTFDSSDKGQWGMNTPAYACIDNIEFTQSISTK